MENINSTAGLKKAIELLEVEQGLRWGQLKTQFIPAYESLKPVNLFRSTLSDITSSPYLIENIIGTTLALATGYLSKKIVVGTSVNRVRKLLGAILQFGVTNFLVRHSDSIKTNGLHFFQSIFRKKESVTS